MQKRKRKSKARPKRCKCDVDINSSYFSKTRIVLKNINRIKVGAQTGYPTQEIKCLKASYSHSYLT